METQAQLVLLADVAIAMVFGGAIGIEREAAEKPAGVRTHMMVAAAAALMVGLGHALVRDFDAGHPEAVRADPFRIIGAIVTGVSFLGAGTIIRRGEGGGVAGLTTAASLLLTASIGIAVGEKLYWLALGIVVLALLALRGIGWVEGRVSRLAEERKSESSDR